MASSDAGHLARRARAAYERGRGRRAVVQAAPLVLLPASFAFWCAPPALAAAAALGLFLGATAFLWRGEGYGRAVLPGVLAGAPTLALPMLVRAGLGHVCHPGTCWNVCVAGCVAAGITAGLVLWWLAPRSGADRTRFLVAGTALAAATALPACSFAGLIGMGALVLGLVAAAAPALARPALRH